MAVMSRGKAAIRTFLHRAGGLRGIRFWNRHDFRILMYHDFPSVPGLQEALAKQCDHISRHYNVVDMKAIGRHLQEGAPLPKNALAVTVDDGNRDFLLNGYPLFRAFKIPVMIYLVSGFLDKQLWLWWDQIIYILEETRKSSFQFSHKPGQPKRTFPLESAAQRQEAINILTESMKAYGDDERSHLIMNDLSKLLDVDLPSKPPSRMAPMTWSEVRKLEKNGMDFGAHTVTHPVLSRISDREVLRFEISRSRQRIEEELKRPVPHFCYPYGKSSDYNGDTVKIVQAGGFQTSVTAEHGLNTRDTNPFRLKRLSVDPMLPEYYFQERLSGLHSG